MDQSDPPVRPVGRARLATAPGPVRPLGQTGQTGWHSLLSILVVNIYPLFFGKACVPKNTLLDQNCLRAMNTSAIFCAMGDNNLSAISCFFFKLTTKQLAWASIPASWLPTLLVQPPLAIPWTLSCASFATSSFECETNLRDTTSAVYILNLVLCSSHTPCCNQCPFRPDYR